jgi:hypothetical protein
MQNYQRGNSGNYQRGSSSTGNQASRPASKGFVPAPKGTKADQLLKVQVGEEGGKAKYQTITGLFASTTRNGKAYLKGKTRDEIVIPAGTSIVVMANDYEKKA